MCSYKDGDWGHDERAVRGESQAFRGRISDDVIDCVFTIICDFMLPNSSSQEHAVTEPWVSVEQIAEHLGVKRDSIYRWIDRKSLPAHRVGRLWKFKVSEVDEWVRAGGADEEKKQD